MDWVAFQFCVIIWVLCVSTSHSQDNTTPAPECFGMDTSPSSNGWNKCVCLYGKTFCSNLLDQESKCVTNEAVLTPDKCNYCECENGTIDCTEWVCVSEPPGIPLRQRARVGSGMKEAECVSGQQIPKPDECNICLCFEGHIHCTHNQCNEEDTQIGPECSLGEIIYKPDGCNECHCSDGRFKCSNLICIPGYQCAKDHVVLKPDTCNVCACVKGRMVCTAYDCPTEISRRNVPAERTSLEVQPLEKFQKDDETHALQPSKDCSNCCKHCIKCAMSDCIGSVSESEENLKDVKKPSHLELYDKKISIDPFTDMISTKCDIHKTPSKLIHSHAYNGFQQEIKVHSNRLPKDASKLIKVLATSLNNPTLADISKRLSSSSNNHAGTKFVHKIDQSNYLSAHSNKDKSSVKQSSDSSKIQLNNLAKLITSRSQSNETILVVPSIETLHYQNSQLIPVKIQNETFINSVSSTAPRVYKYIHTIYPYSDAKKKLQEYQYHKSPPVITTIQQHEIIHNNPSKLELPDQHNLLLTSPIQNTVDIPNRNSQPTDSLHQMNLPKANAPLTQKYNQYKPIDSGIVPSKDSSDSVVKSVNEKLIVIQNGKDTVKHPPQFRFTQNQPNADVYNNIPSLHNNDSFNAFLQFGSEIDRTSKAPTVKKGHTVQQFHLYTKNNNFTYKPWLNNPDQEKNISITNYHDKNWIISDYKFDPNFTVADIKKIYPQQKSKDFSFSQYSSNNNTSQNKPPKIEVQLNQVQPKNISQLNIVYMHSLQKKLPPTIFEPKNVKSSIPFQDKGNHFETQSRITYNVENYKPSKKYLTNSLKVTQAPFQLHNVPESKTILYKYNVLESSHPSQSPNELEITMSKVDDYSNLTHVQHNDSHVTNPKLKTNQKQIDTLIINRQNQSISTYPQIFNNHSYSTQLPLKPFQDQSKVRILQNRGSAGSFQHKPYIYPPRHVEFPQNQNILSFDQGTHLSYQSTHNNDANLPNLKHSLYKSPQSPLKPSQNDDTAGVPSDIGPRNKQESANNFQYVPNSAVNPTHQKSIIIHETHSQFLPSQNQPIPLLDNRGSTSQLQYVSKLAEGSLPPSNITLKLPTYLIKHHHILDPKVRWFKYESQNAPNGDPDQAYNEFSHHKLLQTFEPNHNQHIVNLLTQDHTQPKVIHKYTYTQFKPSQTQLLGALTNSGTVESLKDIFNSDQNQQTQSQFGSKYIFNSAKDPTQTKVKLVSDTLIQNPNNYPQLGVTDNPNSTVIIQYILSNSSEGPINLINQYPNTEVKEIRYDNYNVLKPQIHPDHDQYKPSAFGSPLKGMPNISGSLPDSEETVPDTVTLKLNFKQDQFELPSIDNFVKTKIFLEIPKKSPNEHKNKFRSDVDFYDFKPDEDREDLSVRPISPKPLPDQDKYKVISNADLNKVLLEQDISTSATDLTESFSNQLNSPNPRIEPETHLDSSFFFDDSESPDRLNPLLILVKKLNKSLPKDDDELKMDETDQLDLSILFNKIVNSVDNKKTSDQDSLIESIDVNKLISSLGKPETEDRILNWLNSDIKTLIPSTYNVTVTKKDNNISKIFKLLSKLTRLQLQPNTAVYKIPYTGFTPEKLRKVINDFKELKSRAQFHIDPRSSYESDRFMINPKNSEDNRFQASQVKNPEGQIVLQEPAVGEVAKNPQFKETTLPILPIDVSSENLGTSLFPKIYSSRIRYRLKDETEECGEGTQWIRNCHGCSCQFGQAMCFEIPDCKLRPFGEPMSCKPYSHFKMGGCYTCECNGDGVAECDATDCKIEPRNTVKSQGSYHVARPIFKEHFDDKKADELKQYYSSFKKLPKDCPDQTVYPTCEAGTRWISNCHKCECNENSTHECTQIKDCELDFQSYGKPGRCKPNSKFYPKTTSLPCVECLCNDEGTPYCPTPDYKIQ